MKKILISLAIVLILALSISCDNQKAIDNAVSEMEERTLSFMNTLGLIYDYKDFFLWDDYIFTTWDFSDKKTMPYIREVIIQRLVSIYTGVYVCDVIDAKGTFTLSLNEEKTTMDVKADNVVIKYKKGNSEEKTLTLSCNLRYYYSGSKTAFTKEYDLYWMKVNGREYKPISTTIQNLKFITATYDKEEVDCRILNDAEFYVKVLCYLHSYNPFVIKTT